MSSSLSLTPTQQAVRPAFLASAYGPVGERVRLSAIPGDAPAWTRGRWALITAWNPAARRQSPEQNEAAQQALTEWVRQAGLTPLPALNGDGEWAEDSLLVPGATLVQARAWGKWSGQAAVLWGSGKRAVLAWEGGPLERFWVVRASA